MTVTHPHGLVLADFDSDGDGDLDEVDIFTGSCD